MKMKKINIPAVLAAVFCMAGIVAAQDPRPSITGIELNAGPRGLILTLSGTGPIVLGAKPGDLESVTASYPELRVSISNAGSALGVTTFAGPEQLPVREISLTETADGVMLALRMRGEVRGPVDVRSSGNQVRMLLTRDPQPEIIWSPPRQAGSDITPEPVDMRKVEERAVRDVQASGGEMFTVGEGPAPARRPAPQAQAAAAPAPAAPRIAPRAEAPLTEIVEDAAQPEMPPPVSRDELVRYRVHGRDPFVPLVKDTTQTELPRVENLRLVGVLEDYRERIALVEDFKNDNRAFALRANDQVEFGKVLRVQRDRVVFLIRDFDVSRSYVLTLSAP
jgi:hypothetical protein